MFLKHAADLSPFGFWLLYQCLKHRKRAVIICRCGALGDVICTLPMIAEVRKRHAGKMLIFVTAAGYQEMVRLSRAADLVYGSKKWGWGFSLPAAFSFLKLVDKVYNPTTTDERSKTGGPTVHLIDDLAASCGFTLIERQPHLYPASGLIQKARSAYGLSETTGRSEAAHWHQWRPQLAGEKLGIVQMAGVDQ